MNKEIEIIGKLLCDHCGVNCNLLEVRKIERSEDGNFVGRFFLCQNCLNNELEDNNEEE